MIKALDFLALSFNLAKRGQFCAAKISKAQPWLIGPRALVSTVPDRVLDQARRLNGPREEPPKTTTATQSADKDIATPATRYVEANRDYKFFYPDFLPNPVYYFRDKIREKLERQDMINRRKQITIPEFYVGSIMAVNVSDKDAPGKVVRFVGICIRRDGYGLRHTFTLRNVIDGQGVEIQFDLYNPTIQVIEVLRLEKRLDDNLTYLQDCPAEYSTVPFDMKPVKLPPGASVPLNTIKVPLKPKPWRHKWERRALQGVVYPREARYEYEQRVRSHADFKPYARWDMMKHYREGAHDDDCAETIHEIKQHELSVSDRREVVVAAKKIAKRRIIPSEAPSTAS